MRRDVEVEVQKRLRPLALQASAAESAPTACAARSRRCAAGSTRSTLLRSTRAWRRLEERRAAAALARRARDEELEALLSERNAAEEELADASGRREGATAALYRLRTAADRLELRRETARAQGAELRAQLALAEAQDGGEAQVRVAATREAARAEREAREAALAKEALAGRLELARELQAVVERARGEREGLSPAARALAEQGEALALGLLEVDDGYERAVAAALAWRAGALAADSADAALALVERARAGGLGPVAVVVPAEREARAAPPLDEATPLAAHVRARAGGEAVASLLENVWLVEPARLLEAHGAPVVTREGHRYDPRRGELLFAGETAEAVLLELEARHRAAAAEVSELERQHEAATAAELGARERAETAAAALAELGPAARTIDPELARRLLALAERLERELDAGLAVATRIEVPLKARADAGGERTRELAEQLRTLGSGEADLRRAAAESAAAQGAHEVELARLGTEADELRRRLGDEAPEIPAGTGRDELAEKLERSERRLELLGQVNPFAKQEYEAEKERLAELVEQREDLESSLAELDRLRAELTEEVESRFAATFDAVQANFAEVAATLFPGGEGNLKLTEPEDGDDETELGVEIQLRPAGKRITRLSLLSGGEKALGAISFLFSVFLARPSPFYLLDEVEAALDDTNIGRFVDLLRRYADRAQFIVVTHQKRTMEAADVLYGVTMGPDGVSQIVSRRTPSAPQLAAAS